MSNVFVIEPYDRVNVNTASSFGTIVYLFPLDGDRSSVWSSDYEVEVLDRLEALRFDPKTDHIAVVGPMATVVIAVAAIAAEYGHIPLLVFNPKDREYQSVYLGVEEDEVVS